MTTEQKAKAYDEALERAKKLQETCDSMAVVGWCEYIFPELKESKEEQIRKKLLKAFGSMVKEQWGGIAIEDILAWLEKQEEPEDKGEISDGYHTFNELYRYRMLYNAAFFNLLPKYMVHKSKRHHDGEECFGGGWFIVMANLPAGQISNHYELKDWDLFQIPEKDVADEWDGHTPQEAAERLHKYLLEKQGDQEPADNVEPKFKNEDWIIHQGTGNIYQVVARIDVQYQLKYGDSYTIKRCDDVDRCARLWNISDAKDGDVLASKDGYDILIFRKLDSNTNFSSYYNIRGRLELGWSNIRFIPATKGQRDFLFQKMADAGYEWDSEKKELKKIEPKILDPDKVIEWLKTNVYDDSAYGMAMIEQFKKAML